MLHRSIGLLLFIDLLFMSSVTTAAPAITIEPTFPPAIPAASVPTEHPHTLTGDILLYRDFPAQSLGKRNILVYLPPGYHSADHRRRRYPVLYLHDGQNCFDGATSFIPGQEWRFDETAERLIRTGAIEPLIIVGIYNTGMERVNEYTPEKDDLGRGGRANEYGAWLVKELKPFIDRTYRTQAGAASTGLCGSSLGGLVSLYLGIQHSNTFRRLGVLSPSVWWANRAILQTVATLPKRLPLQVWLDVGTYEGYTALPDTRQLRDALIAKGWTLNVNLAYLEAEGAQHSEDAWSLRVEPLLRYLYPSTK
jgi:predicted alpha/beta superfamily hydrolase